jgi:MFS transporter, ACDE family, multidrug resistance protein
MTSIKLLKDRKLYVIFSITLIAVMGVASITPALPIISETLNLTKTQIGLLISAFTFPGIFLTPLAGILADRLGRKTILVPSLFIFSLAGFAIYFLHNFHYIILLRVIQGIGAASLGSLNTTLIGDFFKAKQLPQAMGYNASVLSLSTAFYPLIGGILAGFAWYYPFVLPLLAIPVGIFVIFGIKEPEIEKPSNFKQYLKDISSSILKKEVIAIFILGTLTFIILYGAFLTYLPFLLHQKFVLTPPQIGIFITLSSITSAIVATQIGKLTWKFGSLFLLKTAFFLYLIFNILIPNIANMYILVIPILIFGSAQALNIPSLQTTLAKLAPDNQRGAFMSLNGMVIRLGQTLGPMIIGLGYSINELKGAYYLGTFMALLGLVVSFTMINEKKILSKRH